MLYLIIKNLRSTKLKNRSLVKKINSQLEELPESVAEEATDSKTASLNKKLFDELDHRLDEEKLYLNPDINRDQLIKQLHISKNTFPS